MISQKSFAAGLPGRVGPIGSDHATEVLGGEPGVGRLGGRLKRTKPISGGFWGVFECFCLVERFWRSLLLRICQQLFAHLQLILGVWQRWHRIQLHLHKTTSFRFELLCLQLLLNKKLRGAS